jgi:hypothetical protein
MSKTKLVLQIIPGHKNLFNKRSTVKYCEEKKHRGSEIMREKIVKKCLNPLKNKGKICPMLSVTILNYYL